MYSDQDAAFSSTLNLLLSSDWTSYKLNYCQWRRCYGKKKDVISMHSTPYIKSIHTSLTKLTTPFMHMHTWRE